MHASMFQSAMRQGADDVPDPATTPFVAVKSASPTIRIGPRVLAAVAGGEENAEPVWARSVAISPMHTKATTHRGVGLDAPILRLLARRELRGARRPSSSDPPDRPDRHRSRRHGGQNPWKLIGDEAGEPSRTGAFGSRGSERVNVHGGPVHLIRSRVGGSSRINRPCAEPEGDDRHVSGRRRGPRRARGKMYGHA